MLTEEEWKKIGELNRSAQICYCSVGGLFGSPEAVDVIRKAEAEKDGLIGIGSKIGDKYGKHVSLRLPPILFDKKYIGIRSEAASKAFAQITAGFVGSVYELLKDRYQSTSPTWQFFRHVRNASFHGNKFNLHSGQPNHPAHWRGLEIDRSLNGTPLIYDFLAPGDVFLLMSDVVKEIGVPPEIGPVYSPEQPDWEL